MMLEFDRVRLAHLCLADHLLRCIEASKVVVTRLGDDETWGRRTDHSALYFNCSRHILSLVEPAAYSSTLEFANCRSSIVSISTKSSHGVNRGIVFCP